MNSKTIERQNQKIYCDLSIMDNGTLYPEFDLRTSTAGKVNNYIITAKICGLNECKENSLYFVAQGVKFIGESTNEETLIDSAVIDIFEELTQE